MPDVLTSKSYKSYNKLSRYAYFPYYYNTVDDKYVYGITANLDTSTAFSEYVVKAGDTLDLIALNHYNDPTRYWIIADFNRILDPFEKLTVGQKLKIPVLSNIEFIED